MVIYFWRFEFFQENYSLGIVGVVVTPGCAVRFGGDPWRHLLNLVVAPCGTFLENPRFMTLFGTCDVSLPCDSLWHMHYSCHSLLPSPSAPFTLQRASCPWAAEALTPVGSRSSHLLPPHPYPDTVM